MGKRVNYRFIGPEGDIGITLYCNNSHPDVDPDRVFREIVERDQGPTEAVRRLLDVTYPSWGGNHRSGDSVFTVDLEPGDHEYVVEVRFPYTGKPQIDVLDEFTVVSAPAAEASGAFRP